ncbi:hypothetical protein [Methylomonas sp. HYX-M1]|uniref:hypothetical protein n=1 Tax=Methylomonas sp. HYX-M1 TaxID=3139307 RepID=UPI00345B667B
MKSTFTKTREIAAMFDLSEDDPLELEDQLLYLVGRISKALDAGRITTSDPEAELALLALLASISTNFIGDTFPLKHHEHNTVQ